jgi:glycosyltransferase involved in cell wall biosynthesis
MHILQVTLGFLPADGWGGPVKIVHANSKELIRRGHQVTVYCTNLLNKKKKIKPKTFEQEIDGIRVVYFNTWHIPQWPGTIGPIWLPDMGRFLANELPNFDLIHLNGYRNLMNIPVVKAAKRFHKPIVMQPHGAMPVIVNSYKIKQFYDQLLGRMELTAVQAFMALQESEKNQIMAHGISAENIEIIPNGLDIRHGSKKIPKGNFRQRYNIPTKKPLFLFLGRINPKKGTDMLIDAFAHLNDHNAYLAIVGPDDGQLSEVRFLIEKYHLSERVIITGLLSGNEVLEAYQDADLFVLPCRTDTFPTTMMEACLAETPMVITEGCEIVHLVKDRVAEVTPFDPQLFAQAMRKLLTDKALYRRYQANCPLVMQDTFSVEATVDLIEDLYQRVVIENLSQLN